MRKYSYLSVDRRKIAKTHNKPKNSKQKKEHNSQNSLSTKQEQKVLKRTIRKGKSDKPKRDIQGH